MATLVTQSSSARMLELLEVLASNSLEATSKISTVDSMALTLSGANATNQASLRQWTSYLDDLNSNLVSQRRLVDSAVLKVEAAMESLNSIVSGDGVSYSASVDQLNALRDKFMSFYSSYADLAVKLGEKEDGSVIQHLMSAWDDVHGPISGSMSSYQDNHGDAVGDHVVEWSVPSNHVIYKFTNKDTAAGATATKLYTPGKTADPTPVSVSVTYERCSSPYSSSSGVNLDWIVYLPPQIRRGCFQKFVFIANGSPGVHRWQYKCGNEWRTIADVSALNIVQFYAPFDQLVEFDMLEYGGTAETKVSYRATITRTRYGGYLRLEPVGPLYPPTNKVFHAPLRCLVMNGKGMTGHRFIVDSLDGRNAYATDGSIVYVTSTNEQYTYLSGTWSLSGAESIVDEVRFTGMGIIRRNCVFE